LWMVGGARNSGGNSRIETQAVGPVDAEVSWDGS